MHTVPIMGLALTGVPPLGGVSAEVRAVSPGGPLGLPREF